MRVEEALEAGLDMQGAFWNVRENFVMLSRFCLLIRLFKSPAEPLRLFRLPTRHLRLPLSLLRLRLLPGVPPDARR